MSTWYQAVVLHYLAECLHHQLENAEVTDCFTTSKDDWFLITNKGNIHVTWFRRIPYIFFPETHHIPQKNRQKFHPEINGFVRQITSFPTERRIDIVLNQGTLILAFYGNNSKIFWQNQHEIIRTFRGKSDGVEVVSPRSNAMSKKIRAANANELRKQCPFFPDVLMDFAATQDYFDQCDTETVWKKVLEKFASDWFIDENGILKLEEAPDTIRFANKCEAVAFSCKKLLRKSKTIAREQEMMAYQIGRLQRLEKQRIGCLKKIEMLNSKTAYKTQADAILTYSYLISKGMKEIKLPDFSGNQILIKLKPELSPAENAERYYRKSKGEHKELEIEQLKLKELEAQIENLSDQAEIAVESEDKASHAVAKGYYRCTIEGFEVWVGKHAKGNMEILRKAAKSDIWMHARDEKGAHVIMRCGNKKPEPYVLEKAASLAAWNSKGKGNSLVRVVWAYRKHVRPIPGMNLGTVAVQLEHTILAEPLSPDHLES